MSDSEAFLTLVIIMGICAFFTVLVHGCGRAYEREKLVEQKVAEYYLDKNHKKQWRPLLNCIDKKDKPS